MPDNPTSKSAESEEFRFALHLAIEGITGPLREYVEAGKPIPNEMVAFPRLDGPRNREECEQWYKEMLAGKRLPDIRTMPMFKLVRELLGDQHPPELQKQRGRRRGMVSELPEIERAQHHAASLVDAMRYAWLREHQRKRLPADQFRKMTRIAIAKAARKFGIVPAHTLKESKIKRLLLSGRFSVN